MEQVDQIIDVLNWLRDNNKINPSEQVALKEYYSKNHNDIDAIKDELLSFNESHDSVISKINQINTETQKEIVDNSPVTPLEQEVVNETTEVKPLEQEVINEPIEVKSLETNNVSTEKNQIEPVKEMVNDNSFVTVSEVNDSLNKPSVDIKEANDLNTDINQNNSMNEDKVINDLDQFRTLVSVRDIDKYIESTYSDGTIKTVLNTLGFPGSALFIKLKQKYTDFNIITDMYEKITKDCPLVSEVKTSSGEEKGNRISLATGAGKLYDYDREAAKINVLFFVFLMGLSLGMVVMIVLNYLKK